MVRIAVLMTCHDRCELTSRCLRSVIKAATSYNKQKISLDYFITDDACTDGTADAAMSIIDNDRLHIIKADGNAFWAGGMRKAWSAALSEGIWDFYLLLNDDTEVGNNLFDELFNAHDYSIQQYSKPGIYSGNTCSFKDPYTVTFGGKIFKGRIFKRFERLLPSGIPQHTDIVNANILFVSKAVVDNIGIFPSCYVHGAADNDYGFRANRAGFPVLITEGICGSCEADNYVLRDELFKLKNMSIKKRYNYLRFPVHSIMDTLRLSIRWRPTFIPYIIARQLCLFLMPGLLYTIICKRG